MDFKWSDLEPKPNNWLGLVLRYEGVGSAEFVSPEGTIRGKGVATFDEYGNSTVEIECESFSIDPQYTGGPVGFLFGSKVEETQGKKTMAFGGFDNPCKTLSINCRRGVPCEQYRSAGGMGFQHARRGLRRIGWTGPETLAFLCPAGQLRRRQSQSTTILRHTFV